MIRQLLLIPHIKIHNANALSSPFTIGFPAMTAWLGATHALQRKLNNDGFKSLVFKATGVLSHNADLQTFKGVGDYVHSIVGTGNPLDKNGNRPSFIEEARIHLEVSLVIELEGLEKIDEERFLERVYHYLLGHMKMASGDIFSFKKPILTRLDDEIEDQLIHFRKKLMPSYAIVERKDLMIEAMHSGADAVDAMLDYLSLHHSCTKDDEKVLWNSERKVSGWIVPIAVGFQGISPIGKAKNQRDVNTPHRFAESVVTLGEFKMPYKITSIDEILWRYSYDEEESLYLCEQTKN
ncbi:type I-F CRISPR-associated protein Csy2 [Poseidonibacter antarcticus]|uniref:type I-F CRISPR-associated protein Csy2 n=1 Tax=Poseidonibacter antarcticus TaxID=2478538 RepID=UPI000EF45B66|nr:type I-F CRISPR-associated protein Csy2 [Poseidonibacter antarcticus]